MVDYAYWHSLPVVLHGLAVTQALAHMFTGIFLYDVLLSLPFDWQVLTGKRKRHWVHLAYFGTRLSMLGYCIAVLVLIWAQQELNCRVAFYAIELLMGTTVFASSVLLAFRTVCVYHGRQQKIVKVVIAFMAAALLAAWMQGVDDVLVDWNSQVAHPAWAEGVCIISEMKQTYWVKYVVTIVFDATILILTTIGVVQMAGSVSGVGMVLIQQGIVYFIITLLVNLLITILTLLHLNDIMSLLAAITQSVICVICSCRLYRNLADGVATRELTISPSGGGLLELDGKNSEPSCRGVDLLQRLFRANSDLSVSRSRGELPSFVHGNTPAYDNDGAIDDKSAFERYARSSASPASSPTSVTPDVITAEAATQLLDGEQVDFVGMILNTHASSTSIPNTPTISRPTPSASMSTIVRKPPSPSPVLSVSINVEQQQTSSYDVEAQQQQ